MSNRWFTPNPYPHDSSASALLAAIFGKAPSNKVPVSDEDLEHIPFRGLLYWSRKVLTETIKKESKYSFSVWMKTVKKNKSNAIKDHKEYWDWKQKQPKEDLITPFGKRLLSWANDGFVYQSFVEATRFYAGYLIRENKKAIKDIKSGKVFLEYNWERLIQARSHLQTLESAMYRLEMTNAGFWDYDCEFAENFCWIDALWAILKHQKINPQDYHKDWEKHRSNFSCDWWLHKIDPNAVPDSLTDLEREEMSILLSEFDLTKWEK